MPCSFFSGFQCSSRAVNYFNYLSSVRLTRTYTESGNDILLKIPAPLQSTLLSSVSNLKGKWMLKISATSHECMSDVKRTGNNESFVTFAIIEYIQVFSGFQSP